MNKNVQIKTNQNGFITERVKVIRMNLHYILYIMAFLSFGLSDGISGAYMMGKFGTGIEANPVARYLFMEYGSEGLVIAKVFSTLAILLALFIIQLKFEKMYWTVNGLLFALFAGGMMAVNANLNAIAGGVVQASMEIILIFIYLIIILAEIGYYLDRNSTYPKNVGFGTS